MAVASDTTLKRLVKQGYFPEGIHIGPCSFDLKLGRSFTRVISKEVIDLKNTQHIISKRMNLDNITLWPHEFILASTEEYIKMPDHMAGFVSGRSSIGRLGLQIQNAGFVDAGFEGNLTLELCNQAHVPIKIHAGQRICQLSMHILDFTAEQPYLGKYKGQTEAQSSKLYLDSELTKFTRMKDE